MRQSDSPGFTEFGFKLKNRSMSRFYTYLACIVLGCSPVGATLPSLSLKSAPAETKDEYSKEDSDTENETDEDKSWDIAVNLAFELTTPSGSHGKWATGGGGILSVAYVKYVGTNYFLSTGAGGYYTCTGTDFVPETTRLTDASVKNWGIRVPVYGGMAIDLFPGLCLQLATGPQININAYAHEQLPPDFSGNVPRQGDDINLFGKGFKRLDLQWGLWAGFVYHRHYTVGLTAGVGLTPEAKMHYGPRTLSIRRNNVALVLSYTF